MNRYLTAASLSTLAIAAIVGTTFAGVTTPPVPVVAQNPATSRAEESWPMPVETFLEGNYLKRSDIVLTRRDWDLTSWVIRWATGSPFSHAALIFTGPQFESGFSNTFVIEASTAGVDLTNLRDYIADKSSFLAVKRFKKEWFDEPKQSRVRGLLLDKIKADYNFWALGHIARNIWFGVERSMRGDKEAIQTFRERDWTPPNEYICSGLVQIGFVEAVLEYIKSDQLPPSALREVVFQRVAASRLPEKDDWQYLDPEASKTTANLFRNQNFDALESVTPEDLALSDKLEWLYMIKNGLVYKADSYDGVRKVIE
ncbi:MAG: YiiX/YebB-like N1pC/P60 family cysteine hydrolase [Hyphomicrobium sp.]